MGVSDFILWFKYKVTLEDLTWLVTPEPSETGMCPVGPVHSHPPRTALSAVRPRVGVGREGQGAWLEQGKKREGSGLKVVEFSALSTFPPSVWSGNSHHSEGNELEGEHSYLDCHLCHSPILRTFPWYLKKGCLDVDKEDHWGPACSTFLFAFHSTSCMFSSIQPIYSDCKLCLGTILGIQDTEWNSLTVRQKSLHSKSIHSCGGNMN